MLGRWLSRVHKTSGVPYPGAMGKLDLPMACVGVEEVDVAALCGTLWT